MLSNESNLLTNIVFGLVVGPPTPTEVPDTRYTCPDCGENPTHCDGRCNDCTETYLTPPDENNEINALEIDIKERFDTNPPFKMKKENAFEK
jgi:predicted ATP-dependent serine protease